MDKNMEQRNVPKGWHKARTTHRPACLAITFQAGTETLFWPTRRAFSSKASRKRAQASQALAEMARDILPQAPDGRVLKIHVVDGDGLVLELRLTYAVESGER